MRRERVRQNTRGACLLSCGVAAALSVHCWCSGLVCSPPPPASSPQRPQQRREQRSIRWCARCMGACAPAAPQRTADEDCSAAAHAHHASPCPPILPVQEGTARLHLAHTTDQLRLPTRALPLLLLPLVFGAAVLSMKSVTQSVEGPRSGTQRSHPRGHPSFGRRGTAGQLEPQFSHAGAATESRHRSPRASDLLSLSLSLSPQRCRCLSSRVAAFVLVVVMMMKK